MDLEAYLHGEPAPEGEVRVFKSTAEDELVGGEAATARVGDFVLENEGVRFVVEEDDRVIGPCPYGGNVIDASVLGEDGAPVGDVVGELCLFLNIGWTLKPDRFEILSDGSDGVGVLAVTGHLELLDFINIPGVIRAFVRGIELKLSFDVEADLPVTVTLYYVLRPGDRGVRVVTAVRNDGEETVHAPFAHLVDSGGDLRFFVPTGSRKGFGYDTLGSEAINGIPLSFVAFRGPAASHAYVPDAVPGLGEGLPAGGAFLGVSGVAIGILGTTSPLATILSPKEKVPSHPGFMHIGAGETVARAHWHLVSRGALAGMLDFAWRSLGAETGTIGGVVRDSEGAAVKGARVTAVDAEGRALNQDVSGADGAFAMEVPAGAFTVRAYKEGYPLLAPAQVTLEPGGREEADVEVGLPATLKVRVKRPDGSAVPAKITVSCEEGKCPARPTSQDRDISLNGPLGGTAATVFLGMSGEATIPLAPGSYRVAVTRGFEWSVWPPDAVKTLGHPITVVAGDLVELDAEIAHVVDTTGALSGDFHVHGINSPDSPISKPDRVRSFLGEGVDVLVSTDHDYITDYAPTVAELGAQSELVSVIGEELTTFDYGHYNSFPLERDPASRNGGAFDWAGGPGPGHTPEEIFAWFNSHEGEQVIQVNHAASGYISTVRADVVHGTSGMDPENFRLDVPEGGLGEDDTGLWSEDFTAIEIMNGHSQKNFWAIFRWWLTMIGRGFAPTGTAVSDTHKTITSQAGGPRSFVFVSEEHDSTESFDLAGFVSAVNGGRLIGSNGPFFRVRAVNKAGDEAGLGDTLATGGEAVTFEVELDLPEWMVVDTIDVYTNLGLHIVKSGSVPDGEPVSPSQRHAIELAAEDLFPIAEGSPHRHYKKTVSFDLLVQSDAYVVLLVRGLGEGVPGMFPVVHNRGVRPLAFTNPIFLDAEGGGYDHPPLEEVLLNPEDGGDAALPRSRPQPRAATMDDARRIIRSFGRLE